MINNLPYKDMYKNDRYVRMRFEIYRELLPGLTCLKALDLGCYIADFLKYGYKYKNYLGVDNDMDALKIAEQRGARILCTDLDKPLPIIDEKFGIVLCTELLEHLKDPERLLNQIKDLIIDGSRILISLPNECTLYHRLKVLFGKGIDGTAFAPSYHLHFPTIKQNRELVSKHFKIIKTRYWFHLGTQRKILPDWFCNMIINIFPTLFARGVIFLVKRKDGFI